MSYSKDHVKQLEYKIRTLSYALKLSLREQNLYNLPKELQILVAGFYHDMLKEESKKNYYYDLQTDIKIAQSKLRKLKQQVDLYENIKQEIQYKREVIDQIRSDYENLKRIYNKYKIEQRQYENLKQRLKNIKRQIQTFNEESNRHYLLQTAVERNETIHYMLTLNSQLINCLNYATSYFRLDLHNDKEVIEFFQTCIKKSCSYKKSRSKLPSLTDEARLLFQQIIQEDYDDEYINIIKRHIEQNEIENILKQLNLELPETNKKHVKKRK